jgi:MFS family permease
LSGTGLAFVFAFLPGALLGPFENAIADRVQRHLVLGASGALATVAAIGGALATAQGEDVIAIYIVVALVSSARVVQRPAVFALMPLAARTPEELTQANLAMSILYAAATLFGPIAASLLLVQVDAPAAFLGLAAVFVGIVVSAFRIRIRSQKASGAVAPARFMAEGVVAVARDRRLAAFLALFAASNAVQGAYLVLLVEVGHSLLGLGRNGYGALVATMGAGGMASVVLVLALARRTSLARFGAASYCIGWGLCTLAIGLYVETIFVFAVVAFSALVVAPGDATLARQLQRTVPATSWVGCWVSNRRPTDWRGRGRPRWPDCWRARWASGAR